MSKTAVKQKRGTSLFYTINRILIGITLIASVIGMFFVNDDSQRSRFAFAAVQSLLFLLCSFVPNFLEKKAKVNFSNILLVIYLVVCICHFVLGEIFGFYVNVKGWDSILHTFTGATLAIVSFSMINLLNENVKGLKLSPLFVAIFAVCFAVTIGVLWEVVEYFADQLTGSNMQRYMDSATGEQFIGRNALKDTMKDLMLDTIGATIFATIGYFALKHEKNAFEKFAISKKEKHNTKKDENQTIENQAVETTVKEKNE